MPSAFAEVTVILTVWKRNNISEQLNALSNQTEKPFQIWICHYEDYINIDLAKKRFPYISIIKSDINFKYYGRFALAHFVKSKYVWILDDDVIPSNNWLEESRKTCELENAIVSSAGRVIPNGDYMPERMQNVRDYFFGDVTPNIPYAFCEENTIVDFGCNGWLLKSEWIKTFWQVPACTLETAEDIHLSAVCKMKLGVSTIVLRQINERTTGNLKIAYGRDAFASWTKPGFMESREKVIRYLVEQQGWRPLLWCDESVRV